MGDFPIIDKSINHSVKNYYVLLIAILPIIWQGRYYFILVHRWGNYVLKKAVTWPVPGHQRTVESEFILNHLILHSCSRPLSNLLCWLLGKLHSGSAYNLWHQTKDVHPCISFWPGTVLNLYSLKTAQAAKLESCPHPPINTLSVRKSEELFTCSESFLTSSRIEATGRLLSRPRVKGTMQ